MFYLGIKVNFRHHSFTTITHESVFRKERCKQGIFTHNRHRHTHTGIKSQCQWCYAILYRLDLIHSIHDEMNYTWQTQEFFSGVNFVVQIMLFHGIPKADVAYWWKSRIDLSTWNIIHIILYYISIFVFIDQESNNDN